MPYSPGLSGPHPRDCGHRGAREHAARPRRTDMSVQDLKGKLRQELIGYGINVIYLTLVFGAFTMYRRLLLAAHDISYANYGVALIEALILGKVIMIGDVLRLGRGLETKPLIYATLYKTTVFCVLVAVFKIVEHGIKGLWKGEGFVKGAAEMAVSYTHLR